MELNKRFVFSPEFPVFSNIYYLAGLSLNIGFHGSNCCLKILVVKQLYEILHNIFLYFRVGLFKFVYIHSVNFIFTTT